MRALIIFSFLVFSILIMSCPTLVFSQKRSIPPFSIDKRPQPSGTNLEILLPPSVGAFKRGVISGNTDPFAGEDITAQYQAGKDRIFFGFSIGDTENDVFEAIKITRQEAINSKISIKNEQYVIGKNPSFFKIGDFMSWSRGRYFFYAKGSSAASLDHFMKAFPF